MSLKFNYTDTLLTHLYTDATKRALTTAPLPLEGCPKDQDRRLMHTLPANREATLMTRQKPPA
ncbi:hypothetical protein [Pseudomonas sp. W5-01]|uniref:hypothetical protein n=1 Tax=Pseudomonas sp. W5-01 TaxID=3097454 RepID=UPI00397C7AC0